MTHAALDETTDRASAPGALDRRIRCAPGLDPGELAGEFAGAVASKVRFANGNRALSATDAFKHRLAPIGLVVPERRPA